MKKLLVVGCGFPQLSLIRRARQLDVAVVSVDRNPKAVGVEHASEFLEVSTSDIDGVARCVRESRADGVTSTGSELAVATAAAVAEKCGMPFYADTETIRRCQEKDLMRAAYKAGGVSVPTFDRFEDVVAARAFAERIGFPIVVKPSRGWGQRGVARVDALSDFDAAFDGAKAECKVVVVEEHIEGREYSVNGWIESGELVSYCVTERITIPGKKPLGVMLAEVYPSRATANDEARMVEEARRGARALGLRRGPCYSQIMLGPKGAFLMETAARMGGGFDADVTLLASGVDLLVRTIGVALGKPEWENSGKTASAHAGAIVKFFIGKPGIVSSIQGVERANQVEGTVDARVFVPVGERIHPLTDSAKRAGYVLTYGSTREEAEARADAALACFEVTS